MANSYAPLNPRLDRVEPDENSKSIRPLSSGILILIIRANSQHEKQNIIRNNGNTNGKADLAN